MATMMWTDWANGGSLLTLRTNLNSFNGAIETQVNSNTTSIATNTGDIADNIADIATNTGDIADNIADIVVLNTNAPFAPTYDYIKETEITVTDDVYEEIARLTTPSRPTGTYKLSQSMLYTLNSTTTSAYFRFSLDGGSNWAEIRREPKDNTDTIPSAYTSTVEHTVGIFDLIIQARKENAGDVLVVSTLDVIFERKI